MDTQEEGMKLNGVKRMIKQVTGWETIIAKDIADEGLVSKI